MIRELRSYDPKPGLRFGATRTQAAVPDLFVARTRTGWAIELNSATLPRVLVNRSYYVELSAGKQDKAGKAWLSECLTSANWLVKALRSARPHDRQGRDRDREAAGRAFSCTASRSCGH